MSHDSAEVATAPTSEVHSEVDAMKWMVEGVYLVEGETITAKKLSHIMLQIAASIPKLMKQGANTIRAAAFILESLAVEQEGRAIGDAVGAHFGAVLKEQLTPSTSSNDKHITTLITIASFLASIISLTIITAIFFLILWAR